MMMQYRRTPLMYAAQKAKSPKILECLLKAKANVNARDKVSN